MGEGTVASCAPEIVTIRWPVILATSSIRRLAENPLANETSRGTFVLSAETRQARAG